MSPMRRILIDIPQDLDTFTEDSSLNLKSSVRAAVELVEHLQDAHLILFSYVYSDTISLSTWFSGSVIKNAQNEMIEQQLERLQQVKVQLENTSITIETKVVWSKHLDDGLEVAYGAEQNLPELVIQPSRHHFFAAALVRQPEEWRMIRMPHVPVVLQQLPGRLFGRVLLAIDVAEGLEESVEHAEQPAIEYLQQWCEAFKSELHIVNAYPSAAELMAFAPAEWTIPQIQSTLEGQHRERLVSIAQKYDIPSQRVHVGEGPVATVLEQCAEKIDAHLVSIASHCRRGISGFFIGNTAETVLEHTRLNLLVIKPQNQ